MNKAQVKEIIARVFRTDNIRIYTSPYPENSNGRQYRCLHVSAYTEKKWWSKPLLLKLLGAGRRQCFDAFYYDEKKGRYVIYVVI